ncbi:MAG TPA: lysozyme inhibitor LprI family protein, partial [Candidatus Angelobacter sp.]
RELNATYQGILKKYADDPAFIGRLRTAQRAWLKFRDAQLQMKFPPSNQVGSVAPMCHALYKAELTQARTRELKIWLDGIEEGDVCAGSVKTR